MGEWTVLDAGDGHPLDAYTERQDFEPESARLAAERTLGFLREHLG
jgi:hypothetical protein